MTAVIKLSAEAFDKLLHAIENPPEPGEALKALMRRNAPWEDEETKARVTAEEPAGLSPPS